MNLVSAGPGLSLPVRKAAEAPALLWNGRFHGYMFRASCGKMRRVFRFLVSRVLGSFISETVKLSYIPLENSGLLGQFVYTHSPRHVPTVP